MAMTRHVHEGTKQLHPRPSSIMLLCLIFLCHKITTPPLPVICMTSSMNVAFPDYPGPRFTFHFQTDGSMTSFLKRALRMEGPQLTQRTIHIKKTARESLGMRIGGGIGSNEGDTPIYVANIHPHGCIGKSKHLKVIFTRMKKFLVGHVLMFISKPINV